MWDVSIDALKAIRCPSYSHLTDGVTLVCAAR